MGDPVWSVRSVRRGNSITSGVIHFRFGGSPPGATCCGAMGAVSSRASPFHCKKLSDVPKRGGRRPTRPLSRSCYKVAALFVYPPMTTSGPPVGVRDALRLRAAALELLAGRSGGTRLAAGSDRTWDVFLRTERCALALKSRLDAGSSAVPDAIERGATRELQRILSARGQLLHIGQLAAAHHIPAIV